MLKSFEHFCVTFERTRTSSRFLFDMRDSVSDIQEYASMDSNHKTPTIASLNAQRNLNSSQAHEPGSELCLLVYVSTVQGPTRPGLAISTRFNLRINASGTSQHAKR